MGRFGWYQFAEGRIRFSGGIPGNGRTGYKPFGVELPRGNHLGEVEQRFPDPRGQGFFLTVPALGAGRKENVGGLIGVGSISQSELDLVIKLLPQLADATAPLDLKQKSSVMGGQYLGKVLFETGWANVRDD